MRKVLKQLKEKDVSYNNFNGELLYNDTYLVENENNTKEIHIVMNNEDTVAIIPDIDDEILINRLITVTWTVDSNGTTIKSGSFHNVDMEGMSLTKLLKEYDLKYKIEKNINKLRYKKGVFK
ncbi:hypothetical protein [Clostridium perfringens]|uniref:hypothetical protein n=1 Tax=Clostridium perfringens TaxID=1502 RepID=UPI0024BD0906|nr:hypothetical protein [Clostridium perfringens]